MIEQTILHLMVKLLLYVIRNRSYIVNAGKTAHFLLKFTLNKIKLVQIMNDRVCLFVTLVTLTSNKFQYIHFPPEIFIRSFSLRSFTLQFRTKVRTCRPKKRSRYLRVFSTRNF